MDKILNVDQLIELLDGFDLKEFHLHHTWKPNHSNYNGSNLQELQNNMRDYHMNVCGWDDIGQHLTLAPDGQFITGRPIGEMPCSIKGHNSKHVLMLEMIGNFDTGHDKFEGPQKEAAMKLTQYCMQRGMEIVFHNQYSSKTCPGTSINKGKFLQEVRAMKPKNDYEGRWSAKHIDNVIEESIMSGYPDGTFKPTAPITREEVAVVASNILEKILG